jgi:hypothetical protein
VVYLILFRASREEKWDPEYYPLDQIGWDVPDDDLDGIGLDTQVED